MRCALAALGLAIAVPAKAASALPDPGKLVTVAELEPIVGKIKKGPTPLEEAGPGAMGCEFTRDVAGDDSWINLEVYPTQRYTLDFARSKFGGKNPLSVPELGQGAFINPVYAHFSAELWLQKGNVLLRVSLPAGEGAAEKLKAIAKKALTRL